MLAVTTWRVAAINRARQWARIVKRDVHAIYLAARDPRVPWYVRMLALCIAGYAVSPFDLIPDFIPVVGLLDDVIVVPLGIVLVLRLIPPDIMAEHRALAEAAQSPPVSHIASVVIVCFWFVGLAAAGWLCYRLLAG